MEKFIHLPEPCPMKWGKMEKVDGQKRFCALCSKNVHDFTQWKAPEIISFIENSPDKVCGRFSNKVLYREQKVVRSRYAWVRALAGVVFFLFYSCKQFRGGGRSQGAPVVYDGHSVYTCKHIDPKTLDFQHKPNIHDTLNRK